MVRRGTAARSGSAVKRARRVNRMGSRISIGAGVDLDRGGARPGGVGVVLGEEPEVEVGERADSGDQGCEGVKAMLLLGAPDGEDLGVGADVGDGIKVDVTGEAGRVEPVHPAEDGLGAGHVKCRGNHQNAAKLAWNGVNYARKEGISDG